MKKRLVSLLVAMTAITTLVGCTDDKSNDISKLNVDKYIINMGDYKGISLESELRTITDDDVEMTITYMLASAPEKKPVTGRTLQQGDVSNIDFLGKVDGVAFEGGAGQDQELKIGSGHFIPGFEDALVGMEIGEVRDIDVTFPEDYPVADLAGKPAVFTVTLNKIEEEYIPELTEEYIKGLGMEGINTIDEFKAEIKKQLQDEAQASYETKIAAEAMNKLLEICEFSDEVPTDRYEYYYNAIMSNDQAMASQYGYDMETYAKLAYGYEDINEYTKQIEDSALRSVQLDLATAKIVELEKEDITSKVLEAAISENYANFGFNSVEEFKETIDLNDYKSYLINEKASDIIISNAIFVNGPQVDVTE